MRNNLELYNPSLLVKTKGYPHSAPSNQLLLLEPWKEALGRNRGSWVDLIQNPLILYAGFSLHFHVACKWSPMLFCNLCKPLQLFEWDGKNLKTSGLDKDRLAIPTTKPMLDLWTNTVENNCVFLLNSYFPGQYPWFSHGQLPLNSCAMIWA